METENIIYVRWGYSMTLVDFYIVIKETDRSMVVEEIGSTLVPDGFLTGKAYPDSYHKTGKTFRVLKRPCTDGGERLVSSFGRDFTSRAHRFATWEGITYNHCD